MFSAFKRLAGKSDGQQGGSGSGMPPGHQTMSEQLQRKFARGIQYNMKVIIKGDRNVGKTCLFNRLQGKRFVEEYIPTEEIQVTSIQWNYKATDDIVKVEVWDVVDRGKKKKRFDGLKLDNSQLEISEEAALDAEFLDVYKGTNGVILMLDITKSWTFEYVQKELPKVPEHIPVIVLANHCDMAHHRTVTQTQISFFIESIQNRASQVRYTESSMRNGFGLKLLHKFFNLPFLQLQRVSLLQQLERNQSEIETTSQELDMYFESDEANYDKFIDQLNNRRRQVADMNSPRVFINTVGQNTPGDSCVEVKPTAPIFIGAGHPIPINGKNNSMIDISKLSQAPLNRNGSGDGAPATAPTSLSNSKSLDFKQADTGFMSKIFGTNNKLTKDLTSPVNLSTASNETRNADVLKLSSDLNTIISVDEFCPDGGQLDKSFLEDVVDKNDTSEKCTYETVDSESDNETGNPLVAGFQDDFEPDDVNSNITNTNNKSVEKTDTEAVEQLFRKTSFSDIDSSHLENDYQSDYYSNVPNSDGIDKWLSTDSKWRRSPEGGEDVSATGQSLDYSGDSITNDDTGSITSFNVNASLLNSSTGDGQIESAERERKKDKKSSERKSEKKHKHKKHEREKEKETASKDKEKKRTNKKKRSRDETCDRQKDHNRRDELEEFLNGPIDQEFSSIDAAYEAF